ncbi:MAG TPA: hypothetical protein ENK68_03880 [Epsilonproteobacteria bacterium]|nr:hypothetical protein [Campylobacterota bacterium]
MNFKIILLLICMTLVSTADDLYLQVKNSTPERFVVYKKALQIQSSSNAPQNYYKDGIINKSHLYTASKTIIVKLAPHVNPLDFAQNNNLIFHKILGNLYIFKLKSDDDYITVINQLNKKNSVIFVKPNWIRAVRQPM